MDKIGAGDCPIIARKRTLVLKEPDYEREVTQNPVSLR